ncbi:MAG TPA: ThuA domain-containing protein [Candidatus Paceibacterota bacterium]|nr:ThuA domain-containing protein [Verrucomicrobiota bacterium]HRY46488.1 ThuA domain-containing protein [Candidatus Paceibacterota bacterium]HSA02400.1 ThuA domain-containing protein [Candidatus Paceibacterota bacterium]
MKTIVRWLFSGLVLGLGGGLAAAAGSDVITKVLVITGGHDFEREPFFKMFQENSGIKFQAVEHPRAFEHFKPAAAQQYDVVVLYDMWQEIPEDAREDFQRLLRQGKGLVALHHCLASYQNWPEYEKIIGGKYYLEKQKIGDKEIPGSTYQHDVRFTVRIADQQHPITAGLSDFEIVDETYGGFGVLPGVQKLLTTQETTSGPVIGWTWKYEKAKVVYMALGHDHLAYENPNFRTLLARAIQWAAGK